jgi:uncharacterized protein
MSEFKRKIMTSLRNDATSFRAVTILGPRQAGKTTLAKTAFPDYDYVSLEDLDSRTLAVDDPRTFLQRYAAPVIIDEVQRVPDLLSYIQGMIDNNPDKKGQYILTGSHQPILREKISQSLAGRTSILTLFPFSCIEILSHSDKNLEDSPSQWIYRGFMPEIFRSDLNPTRMYQSYTQTYVEKDVRQLIQIKAQNLFEKFLKLVAGRVGQVINFDSLANDIGVTSKTIKEWISILEASFILFKLPPYYKNIGKRLIKAPKTYFVDVGLACYLLGIENENQVSRDPLYGQLFENLVVSELYKARLNNAKDPNLFFYRDSHKKEIDILFEKNRKLVPLEIKSSATFNSELIKNVNFFFKSVSPDSESGYLVYSGESGGLANKVHGLNFKSASLCFE